MTIPSNGFDMQSLILTAVSTGAIGKILLMLARTMPPPPGNCGFWCRWAYDFFQTFGENQDKLGAVRPDRTLNSSTLVTDKSVHTEEVTK